MYIFTNRKTKETYIKKCENISPRDFVINNLDLSLEWDYKNFNPLNKGDLIKYSLLNNNGIKEIDTAIPSGITKIYRDLNLDYSFFATVYYKDGTVNIENLLQFFTINEIVIKNEYSS